MAYLDNNGLEYLCGLISTKLGVKQNKITGTNNYLLALDSNGNITSIDPTTVGVTESQLTTKLSGYALKDHTHTEYLPITGGTLTGDLRIKGSNNYGTKINLGDGDYVHFYENEDDCLEIKAKKINFVTTQSPGLLSNGSEIGGSDISIVDNTSSSSSITGSTSVPTMNTLRYAFNRITGPTSADTNYSTAMMRAIYAGTSDLIAGSSFLTSGQIYLVYE